MIIDTHVHVWEIDAVKYPLGPTISTWNNYPDQPGTADELINEMDEHQIDSSVLIQSSWSTWDNSYIADSVKRYPNRLIGQGLIDPYDKTNADKISYWINKQGLSGFRFHPIYYPEEKILLKKQNRPMWDEISNTRSIIQFHLDPKFADQIEVIAALYPDTTMIIDSGEYFATCSATPPTMSMLVKSKSSLLMPGLRAIPAVITTTSEFAVSS